MALTSAVDISIVLSGGTTNSDPNKSLGGDPASAPLLDNVINNLFDDVSSEESSDGHEDYRCIYFFNDGDTSVFNVLLFITEDFDGGAQMQIGIENRNETQRISLTEAFPTGGSITFSYEGVSFVSNYNADLGAWALAMQDSLNSLVNTSNERLLQDVVVTAEVASLTTIFDISFRESDGKRKHADVIVESNDLSPSIVEIAVTTPQQGAPINTIAPSLNTELVPPSGVGFFVASSSTPITLPKLWPNDGFPLWVKRTVEPGEVAVAGDGFSLRFVSESLDPTI